MTAANLSVTTKEESSFDFFKIIFPENNLFLESLTKKKNPVNKLCNINLEPC